MSERSLLDQENPGTTCFKLPLLIQTGETDLIVIQIKGTCLHPVNLYLCGSACFCVEMAGVEGMRVKGAEECIEVSIPYGVVW